MTNIKNKNLITELKSHTKNSAAALFMLVLQKEGSRFEFEGTPLQNLTHKGTRADAEQCFDELEIIAAKYGFELLVGVWEIEGRKAVFVGNKEAFNNHNKGEHNEKSNKEN